MIEIRDALPTDAEAIAVLLTELGYPNDAAFVIAKLEELRDYPSMAVLVAESGGVVAGIIAFDSQPLVHQSGKIGTIMALSVSESYRGQGIGRQLVEQVESLAREAGCIKIGVASGLHRTDAHRFYRELGYEENTKRFIKQLSAQS